MTTSTRIRRSRRPAGSKEDPVRSVRISDEAWAAARNRANREGVTISHVLSTIIDGYGSGQLDLPKVNVDYHAVTPIRRR
jgi:hypothetical protein